VSVRYPSPIRQIPPRCGHNARSTAVVRLRCGTATARSEPWTCDRRDQSADRYGELGLARSVHGLTSTRGWSFAQMAVRHASALVQRNGIARAVTECVDPAAITGGAVQPKSVTSEQGNEFEREADGVSDHVMRIPDLQVQSACACGNTCSTCRSGQLVEGYQRLPAPTASSRDPGHAAAVPVTGEVPCAPSQPLDTATRLFMESRFGHDFSRVRVHTGGSAAASARAVGALAFTHGSDMFFDAGQYAPGTREGRRLLAHELTHVVQQGASSPLNRALPRSNTATEASAGHALPVSADQVDVAVIRERRAGAIQRQRHGHVGPVPPELITGTDQIENAYGGGSLSEVEWRNLLASAEQALGIGDSRAAERNYLRLYRDVAGLAGADRVVRWSPSDQINVVTGNKETCRNAKPGLNLSLDDSSQWGEDASTAFAYEDGTFDKRLRKRGVPQPQVGTVLSRSVFRREKEQTLGFLRHEMIHAELLADDASKALRSDSRDKSAPEQISGANQELLAHVEGFMTMFHLAHPAPASPQHSAFGELLGALITEDYFPWAWAPKGYKTGVLRQLQEYYCNTLDREHREAFDGWVDYKLAEAALRQDKDDGLPEKQLWLASESEDFFHHLQNIRSKKCK